MLRLLIFLFCATASGLPAFGALVHRWNLNEGTGTAFGDSIGGQTAILRGQGATLSGAGVTLPGNTTGDAAGSAVSAYLDLPNGIISSKTNLTVELWVTPGSHQAFQRLLDFGRIVQAGNGAAGEITGAAGSPAPGATQASDSLTLTLSRAALGEQRFEGKLNGIGDPVDAAGRYRLADTNVATTVGTEYHYILTFEAGLGVFGAAGGRMAWWRNGVRQAVLEVGFRLNQIEDVNNWLGRSLWTGDRGTNANYNEVRIYNHALTPEEISASRSAGANPALPVAQADAVTMNHGAKAAVAVLANDTRAVFAAMAQPPQFGTAVVDGFGRIRYTHTTGTPASDSFTYVAVNATGQSTPATVTINFSPALRLTNSAVNVPAAPPATAYQFVDAFPGLTLTDPVCMATPPGETQRLFVCQKGGLLRVIPNVNAATPTAPTFLDLPTLLTSRGESIATSSEQGLLGLAFHPNYTSNRYFYVFYSVTKGGVVYERVSRFTTQAGNSSAADPASELVLIEQADERDNHNGGDLHFGADGYLYITLGDEGAQDDTRANSQRIWKDFFSAILRIDVDRKAENLEPNPHPNPNASDPAINAIPRDGGVARYKIPRDNPFVTTAPNSWNGMFNGAAVAAQHLPYVRSEMWAVGFRNPWRVSFDPPTGELWVGDVGGSVREEIDVAVKGGNYGWNYREGFVPRPNSGVPPTGFTSLPPVHDYKHTGDASEPDATKKGNSITGGFVYRGTRFSNLVGAYIFADYVSGNVWTLRRNGGNPPTVERIVGEGGLTAFAKDPSNGDVLAANLGTDRIRRLVGGAAPTDFPATLGATGLFADLSDLAPNPGLLPYSVNLPFWSDHALKRRWFIIPDAVAKMDWARDGKWTFPSGQIWVKHFDLELTRGNPATRKRLETRLIVKNAAGAYGVSYRWNEAGTDAALVADEGVSFDVNVVENGTPRVQRWQIPSRAECVICHTPQAGHALSANTRQLNLDGNINGHAGNQLELLHNAGYFSNAPEPASVLPRHLGPTEAAFPVEARARSYLAVNCAYCHMSGGTATPAAWDGRPELALAATGLINGNASNSGGNPANKLIVPGDTAHSIVLNRIAVTNGFTRMPPLASNELDQTNIALLTEWIASALPARQSYADWRLAQFGSASSPQGAPDFDADADGASNQAEFLAGTAPRNGASTLATELVVESEEVSVSFTVPPNRTAQIETSTDMVAWSLWDAPGNHGLPLPAGTFTITGPQLGDDQFFRLRLSEN